MGDRQNSIKINKYSLIPPPLQRQAQTPRGQWHAKCHVIPLMTSGRYDLENIGYFSSLISYAKTNKGLTQIFSELALCYLRPLFIAILF